MTTVWDRAAVVFFLLLALAGSAAAEVPPASRCRTKADRGLGILISPRLPVSTQSMRVVVVSEKPISGAKLVGKGPKGPLTLKVLRRGGPPQVWFTELRRPPTGSYRFALVDGGGEVFACGRTLVRRSVATPKLDEDSWWPIQRNWTRLRENLYSAWIEKLFDAPANTRPTWKPLHQVLRDPTRNFLHNHLGAEEDGPNQTKSVVVKPDCADFPYFLRAYFAWKMRLPFGYRQCSRGSSRRPPRCDPLKSNRSIPLSANAGDTAAARFSYFLRRKVSYVHSGAGGTGPKDDESDLYPLALRRNVIRPGAVYVDPAGHLLVVAKWVNQQPKRSGQLFAVESQPDLTVGRKRFWRGAFLFTAKPRGAAGGFKGFRPLTRREGQVVALTNKEIRQSPDYRSYSDEQYRLTEDGFYDRIDQLINPRPLSPADAYREQLVALFELIQKRVDSVHTGEDYMKKTGFKTIQMPKGPRIFQTSGAWEDYSTPARDFRLQVAIHQVLGFPKKVAAQPDRFKLSKGKTGAETAKNLVQLRKKIAAQKKVRYRRSDGSDWTLSMAQVLERRPELEMAYNPNDCIEIRWGATGKELSTCKRHASAEQRKRMEEYRAWFKDRVRPSIR